jgi:hypothetical protein
MSDVLFPGIASKNVTSALIEDASVTSTSLEHISLSLSSIGFHVKFKDTRSSLVFCCSPTSVQYLESIDICPRSSISERLGNLKLVSGKLSSA